MSHSGRRGARWMLSALAICTSIAVVNSETAPDISFAFVPDVFRQEREVEKWPNTDGDYFSVFNYRDHEACPNTMNISGTKFVMDGSTDVSMTELGNVMENGNSCTGGNQFSVAVSFFNTAEGSAYTSENHGNLTRRLSVNKVADQNVKNDNLRGARIGFDEYSDSERLRRCGDSKPLTSNEFTFWIYISGDNVKTMDFTSTDSAGNRKTDTVKFPDRSKGIFLMDYIHGRYCILRTNPAPLEIPTTSVPTTTETTPSQATADSSTVAADSASAAVSSSLATEANDATTEVTTTTSATSTGQSSTTSTTESDRNSDGDDGVACFPGEATVELRNGKVIHMSDLKIGDHVKAGPSTYSPVFAFTHREVGSLHNFIRIRTTSGHVITASPGHYLYANDALVTAGSVRPGDSMQLGSGASSMVAFVQTSKLTGLYNPQTVHGDIVVGGVVSSTYTSAIEPNVAHLALAPLRALYGMFGLSTDAFEEGAETFRRFLPVEANWAQSVL